MSSRYVRVFKYLDSLDAFVVTDEYRRLALRLGLVEWNPVVWIGRLFILDNDYGEHWFDNWELRETLDAPAAELGVDSHDLMVIDPSRLADGRDGPCNTAKLRKRFWTDVLKSLELSYDLLFDKARHANTELQAILPDEYIDDLEERIAELQLAPTEAFKSDR